MLVSVFDKIQKLVPNIGGRRRRKEEKEEEEEEKMNTKRYIHTHNNFEDTGVLEFGLSSPAFHVE